MEQPDIELVLDQMIRLGKVAEGVREGMRASSEPSIEYKNISSEVVTLVTTDSTIFIEGSLESIKIEQLIRILANASAAAERISVYFREAHLTDNLQVSYAAAQRYAVILRDSLGSLTRVMNYQNYVKKSPEWNNLSEGEDEVDG